MGNGKSETEIGDGSIIGGMSFVKGRFPNNVTIAGVPGRVLRKNVAWSRHSQYADVRDCGEYANETLDN